MREKTETQNTAYIENLEEEEEKSVTTLPRREIHTITKIHHYLLL